MKNERSISTAHAQNIINDINRPLNNYHELRNLMKEKMNKQNVEQISHKNDRQSLTPVKRISNHSNLSIQNENLAFFNKDKSALPNISPLRSNNIINVQTNQVSTTNYLKQNLYLNEDMKFDSKALYGYSDINQKCDKIILQDNCNMIQNNTSLTNNLTPNGTSFQLYNYINENQDQNFQFVDNISSPETQRNKNDLFNKNSYDKENQQGSGQKINNQLNSGINLMKPIRTDVTDVYMNRCDFSTIPAYQASSYIYVFGGFIESSQYTIERLDITKNIWEQVDTLPTNRAKFSIVSIDNGNILLIGGKQDGMRIALCEEYDPKINKLTISNMMLSSPKSGFGAVNIGKDQIIIIGGNDGQAVLNTVELYDKNSQKQPIKLCDMIEKRDELAVTLGLDKKIYVIGGFGGSKNMCLRTAERYDTEKNKWESIANLNVPRRALSAVTLPDGIYALGGFDGSNYLSSVEKYDEQLNQWIFISSMNHPRCTLSSVTSKDNQYIYVLGGFDNGPLDSVERYNVVEDKWEKQNSMNYRRFMHSCIIVGGQFI